MITDKKDRYLKPLYGVAGCIFILNSIKISKVIVHELGHAIPALLFYGSQINIHIGDFTSKYGVSVLAWGSTFTFYKNVLNPFIFITGLGGLFVTSASANVEGIRTAVISCGGPILETFYLSALIYYLNRRKSLFRDITIPFCVMQIANSIANMKIGYSENIPLDGLTFAKALQLTEKTKEIWHAAMVSLSYVFMGTSLYLFAFPERFT